MGALLSPFGDTQRLAAAIRLQAEYAAAFLRCGHSRMQNLLCNSLLFLELETKIIMLLFLSQQSFLQRRAYETFTMF